MKQYQLNYIAQAIFHSLNDAENDEQIKGSLRTLRYIAAAMQGAGISEEVYEEFFNSAVEGKE